MAAPGSGGKVLRRAEFERDAEIGAGPLAVNPVFTSDNILDISRNQDRPHIAFGHYFLTNAHKSTRLQVLILHLKISNFCPVNLKRLWNAIYRLGVDKNIFNPYVSRMLVTIHIDTHLFAGLKSIVASTVRTLSAVIDRMLRESLFRSRAPECFDPIVVSVQVKDRRTAYATRYQQKRGRTQYYRSLDSTALRLQAGWKAADTLVLVKRAEQ